MKAVGGTTSTLKTAIGSRYVREPMIILLAYIPYFLARSHAVSNAHEAFQNAHALARFEQSIGIFKELSFQSAAISYDFLVHAFNVIYFYGHWPVIIGFGVYLFIKNPRIYTITRNAFLISGAIALVLYAVYPVAPPRLAMAGIVDTLAQTVPVSYDKSRLVNPYAALPSLHVGWDLLIALGLFVSTGRIWIRVLALLLPTAMFTATVATGNHFFIDGIAGGLLAIVAFGISMLLYNKGPEIGERTRSLLFGRRRSQQTST